MLRIIWLVCKLLPTNAPSKIIVDLCTNCCLCACRFPSKLLYAVSNFCVVLAILPFVRKKTANLSKCCEWNICVRCSCCHSFIHIQYLLFLLVIYSLLHQTHSQIYLMQWNTYWPIYLVFGIWVFSWSNFALHCDVCSLLVTLQTYLFDQQHQYNNSQQFQITHNFRYNSFFFDQLSLQLNFNALTQYNFFCMQLPKLKIQMPIFGHRIDLEFNRIPNGSALFLCLNGWQLTILQITVFQATICHRNSIRMLCNVWRMCIKLLLASTQFDNCVHCTFI